MANYNTQYILRFEDINSVSWRVELALKEGPVTETPRELSGTDAPLMLDKRNNDETLYAPIIPTVGTIQYYVTSADDPQPEIFFDLEVDTWMVRVYKSNALNWIGFLDGKSNNYSWMPYPFAISLTATDFDFMNGVTADINLNGVLHYTYITLGEFFDRTLFHSLPYDDKQLRIAYSKTPDVISSIFLTEGLFIHTDSIFSFVDGPQNVYAALEKLVRSLGARMFFEDGAYWIQLLQDIGTYTQDVLFLSAEDIEGQKQPVSGLASYIGNSVLDDLIYRDASQQITLNRGLKFQQFDYELKAINMLKNFDWRDNTQPPFANWQNEEMGPSFYSRVGTGDGAADPFRLIVPPGFDGAGLLSDVIPARRGQVIQVSVRNRAFITLPGGSGAFPEDFKISVHVTITLSDDRYFLDAGGNWISGTDSPPSDTSISFTVSPNGETAETVILSKPIPNDIPLEAQHVAVFIFNSTIDPDPPAGTTYYSELYPISVGVFSTRYTHVMESVTNNKNYSLNDEDVEMFYLDSGEEAYSNTLFYSLLGDYIPLPLNNWTGEKTIDEIAVMQYIDSRASTNIAVIGSFMSSKFYFYNGIYLRDKPGYRMAVLRDNYNVKAAVHEMMCAQLSPEGTADANYSVIRTNN